nr:MAG TPA: hypothetical protein [Caudoviricetes sp.]
MDKEHFLGARIRPSIKEGYAIMTYIFDKISIEDEFEVGNISLDIALDYILDEFNKFPSRFVDATLAIMRLEKELRDFEQREFPNKDHE